MAGGEIPEDRRGPALGGVEEGLEIVARRLERPSRRKETDLVAEAERRLLAVREAWHRSQRAKGPHPEDDRHES